MGTNPIFESDFDCLTDLCHMTSLQMAGVALIGAFDKHAGSDRKMNKAELRKLLDKEFSGLMKNTTDRNAADEIFKVLDQDENGFVDFQEFVSMVVALTLIIKN